MCVCVKQINNMLVLHITGIIKTPRRVKHNRRNCLHQYKQGGRVHEIDKWMTPQERKNFNNTNNNNFKDKILKTNYFKQSNFNECQWGNCTVASE
jgi:hypothetical protein